MLSAGEVDRMFADFIAHYAEHIADRSRPFPGLDAALDRLAARGCRFAVCTNKLEWLSRLLLDALGLTRASPRSAARTRSASRSPTRKSCGGPSGGRRRRSRRAVMVGDSGTDIATARAAGIPVVAVDFGYSETPVARARPRPADQPFRRAGGGGAGACAGRPMSRSHGRGTSRKSHVKS